MSSPFASPESRLTKAVVSSAMGVVGLGLGGLGTRELGASWIVASAVALIAAGALATVAWRSPETFFKNRF